MDGPPQHMLISLTGIVGVLSLYLFCVLAGESLARSRSGPLRELAKSGNDSAKLARVILMRPERYLLGSQIVMLACCLVAGYLSVRICEGALYASMAEALHSLGVPPELDPFGRLIVTALVFGAVIIFALTFAQFARALAGNCPEQVLAWIAFPLILLTRALNPLVFILRSVAGRVLGWFGCSLPESRPASVSRKEMHELLLRKGRSSDLEKEEKEMLEGVFTFSQTVVREIMTPRKDIVSVDSASSFEAIVATFVNEGFSRILVTGSGLDEVKGILIAKDFLPFIGKKPPTFDIESFLRRPYIVPVSKPVDDLLHEMRRDSVHLAVVVDEHGGTDGIVTIEDLLEEIVGEIFDEFDSPAEEIEVIKTKSGDFLADGSVTIDTLNTVYNFDLPDGDYDTLAGFILQQLGHIPALGETLEYDGFMLRVEQLSKNRIKLVRFIRQKKPSVSSKLEQGALPSGSEQIESPILKTGTENR